MGDEFKSRKQITPDMPISTFAMNRSNIAQKSPKHLPVILQI